MNFSELQGALRAELAAQRAAANAPKVVTAQPLAKSLRVPVETAIKPIDGPVATPLVVFVKAGVRGAKGKPLVKALGDVPSTTIKAARAESVIRRRDVAGADELHGNGKAERAAYRVVFADREMTEKQARSVCSRLLSDGRMTAADASHIEHYLNIRRPLPDELAAKLFN